MKNFAFLSLLLAGASALEVAHPFAHIERKGTVDVLSFDNAMFEDIKELLTPDESVVFPNFMLASDRRLSVELDLQRVEVFTEDTIITAQNGDEVINLERPNQLLLSGNIRMENNDGFMHPVADSRVFLALSPLGSNGYFQYEDTTFILSTPPASRQGTDELKSFLFNGMDMPSDSEVPLSLDDALIVPEGLEQRAQQLDANIQRSGRTASLALDADYSFFQRMGYNHGSATNYMGQLTAAVSEIYNRDVGHPIHLSYVNVWTSTDPYAAHSNSDSATLDAFRGHWESNMRHVSRDTAHLISSKPMGGLAYVGVLCYRAYAYGISGSMSGYFPYPLVDYNNNNWDVYVVAHELGHNFGTGHTHDSYNPPIDQCGSGGSCQRGTIMSYCHICSGGISNIALRFDDRVKSRIEQYLHYESGCFYEEADHAIPAIAA